MDTALRAYTERYGGWRLATRAVPLGSVLAITIITSQTRAHLKRRRARQLGLTIETAPQLNVASLGFLARLAPVLVLRGSLMVRASSSRSSRDPAPSRSRSSLRSTGGVSGDAHSNANRGELNNHHRTDRVGKPSTSRSRAVALQCDKERAGGGQGPR